jgi:hypothetical protein
MPPALSAARPKGLLYRVGRAPDPWAWPPRAYAGEDGTFGNRFDDPAGEYRLLYASSHYGLDDLDMGEPRRRSPPAFTQEISRYAFERGVAEDGERLLGIRYLSRLGDDVENWAIFEGTEPYEQVSEKISREDPDVLPALETLGLGMA